MLRDRKFADSSLEGDGFEPSVPRGDNIFETAPLEASKPAFWERDGLPLRERARV
jgi:hypothetical protein